MNEDRRRYNTDNPGHFTCQLCNQILKLDPKELKIFLMDQKNSTLYCPRCDILVPYNAAKNKQKAVFEQIFKEDHPGQVTNTDTAPTEPQKASVHPVAEKTLDKAIAKKQSVSTVSVTSDPVTKSTSVQQEISPNPEKVYQSQKAEPPTDSKVTPPHYENIPTVFDVEMTAPEPEFEEPDFPDIPDMTPDDVPEPSVFPSPDSKDTSKHVENTGEKEKDGQLSKEQRLYTSQDGEIYQGLQYDLEHFEHIEEKDIPKKRNFKSNYKFNYGDIKDFDLTKEDPFFRPITETPFDEETHCDDLMEYFDVDSIEDSDPAIINKKQIQDTAGKALSHITRSKPTKKENKTATKKKVQKKSSNSEKKNTSMVFHFNDDGFYNDTHYPEVMQPDSFSKETIYKFIGIAIAIFALVSFIIWYA